MSRIKKAMSGPWQPLREVSQSEAAAKGASWPGWMTRAFANNRVMVMVRDHAPTSAGPATRAMVKMHDGRPVLWSVMQRVKNELFGPETWAVQYMPAEAQLVNSCNLYWIWVYPAGVLPIPLAGGVW